MDAFLYSEVMSLCKKSAITRDYILILGLLRIMKINKQETKQQINKTIIESRYEKTGFLYSKNNVVDQLHSNCTADQRLCFLYTDSTFPLLPKSKISSL